MKQKDYNKSAESTPGTTHLPKLLRRYETADLAIREKTRFIYYSCLFALILMLLLIAATAYIQLTFSDYGGISIPVISSEISVLILFVICLVLLVKGKYGLSSHLVITSGILGVWLVMWIDTSRVIARLDTIVMIIALLNLTPLFITKYRSFILLYILVNLAILIVYMETRYEQLGLTRAGMLEFIMDTSIAMLFTGIIGLAIFGINKRVLDKAHAEINERKQAENALALSEKKLRDLTQLLPQTIYEADLQGNITYVNRRGFSMFGYSEEDLKNGINILSILSPEQRDMAMKNISSLIQGNVIQGQKYTAVRKNGTSFPIQSYSIAVLEDKKPVGLRGLIIDISESVQNEKALRESQELMAELLNGIPLPTFMLDYKGTLLYLNNALAKDFGRSVEELLGMNAYDLLPEGVSQDRRHAINKVFEDGKPVSFDDTNNGRYYTNYVYPILDKKGNTLHVVIFALDITDLKQAEKGLKEREELFKSLIKYAPYPTVLTDLEGRYLVVNDAFIESSGFTEDEVIGKDTREIGFNIEEGSLQAIAREMQNSGKIDNLEIQMLANDGRMREYLYSSRIIQWNNKPHILNLIFEITDRKVLERELEKYRNHLELLVSERTEELASTNEELTSTNEELINQREKLQAALNRLNEAQQQLVQSEKMASLGLLSAGIAHEINNPLNFIHGGILGIEEYFKDNLQDHIEEVYPMINAIHVGVRRASKIVTSLNHYSRQYDLPHNECNMHVIIDNCLIMLQSQLKARIHVRKKYTNKSCSVAGNEGQLHQALLNIIANSEQSIEETGSISILTEVVDANLLIKITDTGCGISPDNLKKIFDPFFTTRAPGRGTGLGLSITYNIIMEHNGNIYYESTPGKGTTAFVTLPVTVK
jgi:PAS domain S-box-containing protein